MSTMTDRDVIAWARGYAAQAINGAAEMGQYDALMMPWPRAQHDAVIREVLAIRDELLRPLPAPPGGER